MPRLTRKRAEALLSRVEAIPEDREPLWGELRKDTLIQHLIWAVRGSMTPEIPVSRRPKFVSRYVFRPLLLHGLLAFPKNVKFRGVDGEPIQTTLPGTMDDLRAAVDAFLTAAENGTLRTPPHPVFGRLGPRGWGYFHVQHFAHHLKQFDA